MKRIIPWLQWVWHWTRHLLPSVLLACLLFEYVGLAANLRPVMAPQGIVEGHDNDAGEMVKVAGRTQWWNDNGFRYYGPMYFRIARTLKAFSPVVDENTPASSRDAEEEALHYGLLLTSLAGLFGLSYGVACLATRDRRWRLLTTLFLVPLFLKHPTWSFYLMTAHPDLLLAAFCVMGLFFLARWLELPSDLQRRKHAAVAWAVALSTKASTVFFLPGFALITYFWDRARWKENLKALFLTGLISYLVVGFPQNFDVFGTAHQLGKVAVFSGGFRFDSFIEWWTFWGGQILWPACFAFVVAFLFGQTRTWSVDRALGVFALSQLGFFLMSLKHVDLVHEHYVIPFAAVAVGSLAWVVSHLAPPLAVRAQLARLPREVPVLAVFAFGLFAGSFSSPELRQTVATQLKCRPALQRVYHEAVTRVGRNELVIGTPYTPLPLRDEPKVHVFWEMTTQDLATTEAKFFTLNRAFISRFLTDQPSAYVEKAAPGWRQSREFFEALERVLDFTDAAGRRWHRTEGDLCGLEIWERN